MLQVCNFANCLFIFCSLYGHINYFVLFHQSYSTNDILYYNNLWKCIYNALCIVSVMYYMYIMFLMHYITDIEDIELIELFVCVFSKFQNWKKNDSYIYIFTLTVIVHMCRQCDNVTINGTNCHNHTPSV